MMILLKFTLAKCRSKAANVVTGNVLGVWNEWKQRKNENFDMSNIEWEGYYPEL